MPHLFNIKSSGVLSDTTTFARQMTGTVANGALVENQTIAVPLSTSYRRLGAFTLAPAESATNVCGLYINLSNIKPTSTLTLLLSSNGNTTSTTEYVLSSIPALSTYSESFYIGLMFDPKTFNGLSTSLIINVSARTSELSGAYYIGTAPAPTTPTVGGEFNKALISTITLPISSSTVLAAEKVNIISHLYDKLDERNVVLGSSNVIDISGQRCTTAGSFVLHGDSKLNVVDVQGGILDSTNAAFLTLNNSSSFIAGTYSSPLTSNFVLNLSSGAKNINLNHSSNFVVVGKDKLSYTYLIEDTLPNISSITLSNFSDNLSSWSVGDHLIFPPNSKSTKNSRNSGVDPRDQIISLTIKSKNNQTLELSEKLVTPKLSMSTPVYGPNFRGAPIINLTKNVTFGPFPLALSANVAASNTLALLKANNSSKVYIKNAEICRNEIDTIGEVTIENCSLRGTYYSDKNNYTVASKANINKALNVTWKNNLFFNTYTGIQFYGSQTVKGVIKNITIDGNITTKTYTPIELPVVNNDSHTNAAIINNIFGASVYGLTLQNENTTVSKFYNNISYYNQGRALFLLTRPNKNPIYVEDYKTYKAYYSGSNDYLSDGSAIRYMTINSKDDIQKSSTPAISCKNISIIDSENWCVRVSNPSMFGTIDGLTARDSYKGVLIKTNEGPVNIANAFILRNNKTSLAWTAEYDKAQHPSTNIIYDVGDCEFTHSIRNSIIGSSEDAYAITLYNSNFLDKLKVDYTDLYSSKINLFLCPLAYPNHNTLIKGNIICSNTNFYYPKAFTFATYVNYIPEFDGGSVSFDGENYLKPLSGSQFEFGNGNFTIESWINATDVTFLPIIFDTRSSDTSKTGFTLELDRSWFLNVKIGDNVYKSTKGIFSGVWYHIVLSRTSGACNLWLNGEKLITFNDTTNFTSKEFTIGAGYDGQKAFTGNLFNLRVTKDEVIYNPNQPIQIPSYPVSPTNNTSFLLAAHKHNQIIDKFGKHEVISYKNALSSNTSKFGKGSVYFDGTDFSAITFRKTDNFTLGTSSFTIEGWLSSGKVYDETTTTDVDANGVETTTTTFTEITASNKCIFDTRSSGNSLSGFYFAEKDLGFQVANSETTFILTESGRESGKWQHFALVRDGSKMTLFIDGLSSNDSSCDLTTENFSDSNLTIGGYVNDLMKPNTYFGYMDDFLLIKDSARYTEDFSPGAILLDDVNATFASFNTYKFIDNSINKLPITTVGGIKVRAAAPLANNSSLYNSDIHYGSLYFDGTATSTSIEIPYKPTLFDWWSSDYTLEFFIYAPSFVESSTTDADFTNLANKRVSNLIGNFMKDTTEFAWSFGPLADGTVAFVYQTNNTNTPNPRRLDGNGKLRANTWNHVALSVSSGIPRIYVNGEGTLLPFSEPYFAGSFNRATSQGMSINGNILPFEENDWTVEAWVNLATMPTTDAWILSNNTWSNTFVLIGVGTPSLSNNGFDCVIGQTKLLIHSNDVQYQSPLTHDMNPNTWYHIAYTRSGDNINFYVNGVSKGSVPFTGPMGIGANTYIGSETGQGAYFNGLISNLRVVSEMSIYNENFTPSTLKLSTTGNGNAIGNNILTPTEELVDLLTFQDNTFKDNSIYSEDFVLPTVVANKPTIFTPPVNYPPVSNSSSPLTIGQYNNVKLPKGTLISNLRIIKGDALYSGNRCDMPTVALSATPNTSLLLKATNSGIYDKTQNCSTIIEGTTRNLFIDTSKNANGTGKQNKSYAVYNRIYDVKDSSSLESLNGAGIQFISPFNTTQNYDVAIHGYSIDLNTIILTTQSSIGGYYFNTLNEKEFIIDFFMYPTKLNNSTLFTLATADNSLKSLSLRQDTTGKLNLYLGNVLKSTTSNFIAPLTTWTHVAICRTGTTLKMFKNGVAMLGSVNLTSETFSDTYIKIGNNISNNQGFQGYISNFKIKSDVNESSVSVPTQPSLDSENVDILLKTFENSIPTQTNYNNLTSTDVFFDGTSYIKSYHDNVNIKQNDDLTIEMWVKFNDVNTERVLLDFGIKANDGRLSLRRKTDNTLSLQYGSPLFTINSKAEVEINAWYHIAIVKTIDDFRLFINGVPTVQPVPTVAIPKTNFGISESEPFRIGASYEGKLNMLGHISNLIISKSIKYDSTFIPSLTPKIELENDTIFSLQQNLSGQYYRPIDKCVNTTFTLNDNCVAGVSGKYANDGGIWFNKGQLATTNYISAYDLGVISGTKQQFCFELWFYPLETIAATFKFLVQKTGGSNSWSANGPEFTFVLMNNYAGIEYWNGVANSYIRLGYDTSKPTTIVPNTLIKTNDWNHIAFTCDGTTYRGYLNGYIIGSNTTNMVTPTQTILSFGAHTTPVVANQFVGYMDDIRITKGVPRYTGTTYTVPSAPFDLSTDPDGNKVVMLVKSENVKPLKGNHVIDSTSNNKAICTSVGVSQTNSTPVDPNGWCIYFDGTVDSRIVLPSNEMFKFEIQPFTVELWFYKFESDYVATNCILDYTDNLNVGLKIALSSGSVMVAGLPASNKVLTNYGQYIKNSWNHVALVNTGTILKVFVNGKQTSSDINIGSSKYLYDTLVIGCTRSSTEEFYGLVSNVRIIKGVPLYIGSFKPKTNKLDATITTDLDLQKCELLINGDTPPLINGDTILDVSKNNYTITKMLTAYTQSLNPFYGEDSLPSKPFNTSEHQTDVFREKGIVNSYIGGNAKKHARYLNSGYIETDDTIYRNVSVGFSEKLTPRSNKTRLRSNSRLVALRAYNQRGNYDPNTLSRISVWVKKSSDWSGEAPRLIVVENKSMGIYEDTVLATATGSNDTWIKLEATNVGSVKKTGMLEFYVDCIGANIGSIWIDDWEQVII
jgi:hypothetical protein